jgi:hypothetical protein
MTEDLLDAECVIRHLGDQSIISICDWKNKHPNNQDYQVFFDHPGGTTGDIGLHIIKRSGQYFISRSLVTILSYRHRFNADHIYSECAVKTA